MKKSRKKERERETCRLRPPRKALRQRSEAPGPPSHRRNMLPLRCLCGSPLLAVTLQSGSRDSDRESQLTPALPGLCPALAKLSPLTALCVRHQETAGGADSDRMEGANCVGRHLRQSHLRKLLWQTENYRGVDGVCYRKVGVPVKIELDFLFCQMFVRVPLG